MMGCLRTPVRKQPIIALYFESENEVQFYNLKAGLQAHMGLTPTKPVFEVSDKAWLKQVSSAT